MSSPKRLILAVAAVAAVAAVTAPAALATFPQLHTTLSGPAIEGRVPAGEASSTNRANRLGPGRLEVRVRNVEVPDGTVLTVNLGGAVAGAGEDVGTFTVSRGEGRIQTSVRSQVGRSTDIAVKRGDAVILSALGWSS